MVLEIGFGGPRDAAGQFIDDCKSTLCVCLYFRPDASPTQVSRDAGSSY